MLTPRAAFCRSHGLRADCTRLGTASISNSRNGLSRSRLLCLLARCCFRTHSFCLKGLEMARRGIPEQGRRWLAHSPVCGLIGQIGQQDGSMLASHSTLQKGGLHFIKWGTSANNRAASSAPSASPEAAHTRSDAALNPCCKGTAPCMEQLQDRLGCSVSPFHQGNSDVVSPSSISIAEPL